MSSAFERGGVAVITGGASGIGRAAARKAAAAGMRVAIVDVDANKLIEVRNELADVAGRGTVRAEQLDVADARAMSSYAAHVSTAWAPPLLLMNNAAAFVSGGAGGILDPLENWQRVFGVNLFGAIHGVQAFLPGMLAAGKRARIVNTGSKQGLTNPPGNPLYNTTKAALNAYTQNLARHVREREGSQVSAHLLIPGWTTTGVREHKAGAWLPEQVVDYMIAALERDAFYILCPDDETPNATDHKQIVWNALDIVHDRPALSRWHPDHMDDFAAFMKRDLPKEFGEQGQGEKEPPPSGGR